MLCVVGLWGSVSAAELNLLQNKQSRYQIAIPDQHASPGLREALQQTARLIQTAFLANGAEVPVVTESLRTADRPTIYLGDTQFSRSQSLNPAELRDWSYVIRVVGHDVIILGHDHPARGATEDSRRPNWDRIGTAKGVADFVREFMGVRFLYPELPPYQPLGAVAKVDLLASPAIEFLPMSTMQIPADFDLRKTPLLRANISHPTGCSFYDLAHNRFPRVDEVFGGHTWERAVPPETYWETHPEYFALINGTRLKPEGGNAQYCLSNPDVQNLIAQDLAGWLDRGYVSVDLGQPDGFRPCQCEACLKLYDTGTDWGEKIWIFNRNIAERVLKSHPRGQITMMSYIQTAQPPRSFREFPANTSIMLTGTNEEDVAPWRDVTVPRGFTGYIYNWCPNLGTRYTPMRTPGFVEAQVKRLAANRIQSLYRDGPGQLFGLEGPVFYVMGRMFDDPETHAAKDLLPEFCEAAFVSKSVAFHMRAFYDQLYHAIALYSDHIGTRCDVWTYQPLAGEGRPRKTVQDPFQLLAFLYPPQVLMSLDAELTTAESLATTDKVRTRLALIRGEFDYVRHLARVVHLHQAWQISPDAASRDRLLDAIDARNAYIASLFDARGQGRARGNWGQVLFPFPGHDAKHLRLAYDGYQEPYAATCLNWDTTAMRAAPTQGIKRATVIRVSSPPTLDDPRWNQIPRQELMFVPPLKKLPRVSAVRLMYDASHLYVWGEAELEPGHPDSFPAWNRDRVLSNQEAWELIVQPQAGSDVHFRLAVGANANSRYDAVVGLITDPIDPRFGKEDPTWNGAWDAVSRVDSQSHRWQVQLTIPFRELAVDAPESGVVWRANFGRNHQLPREQIDRAIWSSTLGSLRLSDLQNLGELVFE